jgi:hypothetical protein
VGPGGTSVDFYATDTGIEAVWVNEECPYRSTFRDVEVDEHYRASDGHNIDKSVTWADLEEALAYAIKKGLYEPKKLRRA